MSVSSKTWSEEFILWYRGHWLLFQLKFCHIFTKFVSILIFMVIMWCNSAQSVSRILAIEQLNSNIMPEEQNLQKSKLHCTNRSVCIIFSKKYLHNHFSSTEIYFTEILSIYYFESDRILVIIQEGTFMSKQIYFSVNFYWFANLLLLKLLSPSLFSKFC